LLSPSLRRPVASPGRPPPFLSFSQPTLRLRVIFPPRQAPPFRPFPPSLRGPPLTAFLSFFLQRRILGDGCPSPMGYHPFPPPAPFRVGDSPRCPPRYPGVLLLFFNRGLFQYGAPQEFCPLPAHPAFPFFSPLGFPGGLLRIFCTFPFLDKSPSTPPPRSAFFCPWFFGASVPFFCGRISVLSGQWVPSPPSQNRCSQVTVRLFFRPGPPLFYSVVVVRFQLSRESVPLSITVWLFFMVFFFIHGY